MTEVDIKYTAGYHGNLLTSWEALFRVMYMPRPLGLGMQEPHPTRKFLSRIAKMAVDLLRDNPELRPFVLSNVTLTGTRISAGAYGSVAS